MKKLNLSLLLLLLTSCALNVSEKAESDHITLTPVSFDSLSGWTNDHVSEAIPALALSCTTLYRSPDWAKVCAALQTLPANDDAAARQYFETMFQPYATSGKDGDTGLFTGYYEAELHGDWHRHGRYQTPLYARPSDLINVDLGAFRPEWKGKHIEGKIQGDRLEPYDDRATITKGALNHRAKILLWVDDPVDAYFLAVQGSGRVKMPNGKTVRVGYDGVNGRSYVAIGRILADNTEIERPVTMQRIRTWLAAHPDRAQGIMNMNPSFVFFRILKTEAPIGSEGVPLTPTRSLAVDTSFIPLGTPLWLNTSTSDGKPLERLVISQDTGGAIKGPVRGDFFWGYGHEAEEKAGAMQSQGTYYILRPKSLVKSAETP